MFLRYSRLCFLNQVHNNWAGIRRGMSTAGQEGKKSDTFFSKAVTFITKNRQQLINIFAMYLVVSFGVHNYQVKVAWDRVKGEAETSRKEYQTLREALLDEQWIAEVESKMVKSKSDESSLLKEIQSRITALDSLKSDYDGNKVKSTVEAAAAMKLGVGSSSVDTVDDTVGIVIDKLTGDSSGRVI